MKIRVGLGLGTQNFPASDQVAALGTELESLGFDSLWLSERLNGGTFDPVVSMAYLAGACPKLKFGTSVLVLPGRNPAILAKELATLDQLSHGRLLLAMGLGVVDPIEQLAFGVERTARARIFDEALPLLRRMWQEDHVSHEGEHFHYQDLSIHPKPVQHPLEVWLGGMAPSELRRTGRLGDGWLPSTCTPAEAAAGRELVQQAATEAGRIVDPEHFGASITYVEGEIPEALAKRVTRRRPDADPRDIIPMGLPAARTLMERFVDVGFSKFVIRPARDPSAWGPELRRIADVVLPIQN